MLPGGDRPAPGQRLVFGFVNLLIVGTVVAGMAGAAFLTVRSWQDGSGARPSLLAVLAVGVAALVLALIVWRPAPRTHRPAALLLGIIVVSRIGYTVAVDQPRFSDFAIMWDYAESIATGPYREPGGPGDFQAMVESRAFPYLVPVARLSGGRPWGYQLANALAVGLCALLAYGFACSLANRKAGLIALWLIAFAPEPLIASEIPTHDIPGALFALLAVALGLLLLRWDSEGKRGAAPLGLGLLLGLVLWVADLQRGMGPFLLAAILIGTVLHFAANPGRRAGWAFVPMVLLPLLTTAVLGRTALPLIAGPTATQESAMAKWRWLAIYANSESAGYWDLEGLLPLLRTLDERELRSFALARTASDVVDAGPVRLRNYTKRIATLNRLGSQYHWYLDDSVEGRPWNPTALLGRDAGQRLSAFLRRYSESFRMIFLLLTVAAVGTLVFFGRPDGRLYVPLLTVAVLILALGFLGEAQPRYLFPAWFLMPVYVGWFLTRGIGTEQWRMRQAGRRAVEIGIAAAISGVIVAAALMVLGIGLRTGWPRLIPTGVKTYEGGAVPQGRYRSLLTAGSPAAAIAHLPARGRVTAFTVRSLDAKLPCATPIRLAVNAQPAGPRREQLPLVPVEERYPLGEVVEEVVSRPRLVEREQRDDRASDDEADDDEPDLLERLDGGRHEQEHDDQAEEHRERLQRLTFLCHVDLGRVDHLRRQDRGRDDEERPAGSERIDLSPRDEHLNHEREHEEGDQDPVQLELERQVDGKPVQLDRHEPERCDEDEERVRPGDQLTTRLAEGDDRRREEADRSRRDCRASRGEAEEQHERPCRDDRDDRQWIGGGTTRCDGGACFQLSGLLAGSAALSLGPARRARRL